MKNLRLYKYFDWFLVAISYVAAVLLFNGAVQYQKNPGTIEVMNPLCVAGLVLYGILFFFQFIAYIMGFVYGLTAKESMAKHNMIVKLASIPFFVINLFALINFSIDVKEINPLLTFIMIPISISGTFFIMFRSSFSNVVFFIKSYFKKTLKATPWGTVAIVLSFIFSLDVVAGIILYKHERNQRPDIAERIKAEKLKKIEEWKVKVHKSLLAFKIEAIIMTAIVSVLSLINVISVISYAVAAGDDGHALEVFTLQGTGLLLLTAIVAVPVSLLKMIYGIRYGKRGEEDPTRFLFIMKLVDILPTAGFLGSALYLLMTGIVADLAAVALIVFLAIVIIIFVIIAFLVWSAVAYLLMTPFMVSALFTIWSSSLAVYTYYLNQRAMKNREFSSPWIIVCLVCLWIPILDIPAIAILRNRAKKNLIFGDKPVIVP